MTSSEVQRVLAEHRYIDVPDEPQCICGWRGVPTKSVWRGQHDAHLASVLAPETASQIQCGLWGNDLRYNERAREAAEQIEGYDGPEGCGQSLDPLKDLWRCAECNRWFCADCIEGHFAKHAAAPETDKALSEERRVQVDRLMEPICEAFLAYGEAWAELVRGGPAAACDRTAEALLAAARRSLDSALPGSPVVVGSSEEGVTQKGLTEKVRVLLDELEQLRCACSASECLSGHRTDCRRPWVNDAAQRVEDALVGSSKEEQALEDEVKMWTDESERTMRNLDRLFPGPASTEAPLISSAGTVPVGGEAPPSPNQVSAPSRSPEAKENAP